MSKKVITITAVVLSILLLIGGVTYAFYEWVSGTNTDITFDVDGLKVIYNGGTNITNANLKPTSTKEEGVLKIVEVKLDSNQVITPTPEMNLYLDLTTLPNALIDDSFKWELYKNNDLTSLTSGTFLGKQQGDTITLAANQAVTSTKDTYKLYLWIDGSEENDSSMQGQTFNFIIRATGTNALRELTMAEDIIALASTNTNELWTIEQPVTEQVAHTTTDYRYYGATPNNYVYYNCLDADTNNHDYGTPDYDYTNSCELWRVIGVFETETPIYSGNTITGYKSENRVKIVRNEPLPDFSGYIQLSYDVADSSINSGEGINAWEQSELMQLLNNGAYWNNEYGQCYSGTNSSTRPCPFSGSGLTTNGKSMIEPAKYYLGGVYDEVSANELYIGERGTQYTNCSESQCNDTYVRQGKWTGYVGVIYPSDKYFAAGETCSRNKSEWSNLDCDSDTWLYSSKNSGAVSYGWYLSPSLWEHSIGRIYSDYPAYTTQYILPTLYLSSDVVIRDGVGTSTSPWIIG